MGGQLELYDLRVAEVVLKHEAHTGAIYGLAETPDHKGFVSCSADKRLRFFELTFTSGASDSVTFEEQAEKQVELPDEGMAVAYSSNGKWVTVALLNHTLNLYFADTQKFYLSLYGHRLPVMCVDISSDSQMLASGSADKNVKLWSTQFGNCHRSLRAHEESVMQVRFLPGTHYLASAGRDREVKLWDCDSYELITALKGHTSEILALALSQDAAFIVTAGSDRQMRFWRRSNEQLFLSEERAKELETSSSRRWSVRTWAVARSSHCDHHVGPSRACEPQNASWRFSMRPWLRPVEMPTLSVASTLACGLCGTSTHSRRVISMRSSSACLSAMPCTSCSYFCSSSRQCLSYQEPEVTAMNAPES